MMTNQNRQKESGNVLFLILIAVALFAALSYAVTQSTRSGSGTTERETVLLNSAGLTQYPTTLRTAVVRMILSGFNVVDIGFDSPSSANFNNASARNRVFHPQGGGAVYQTAPLEVMSVNASPNWRYNGNFEIPQIGQSGAGGNDLIAFLPRVTISVCRRLNEELGITTNFTSTDSGIPDYDAPNASLENDYTINGPVPFPTAAVAATNVISNNAAPVGGDFIGQPAACFRDPNIGVTGGVGYVFYSVLLER